MTGDNTKERVALISGATDQVGEGVALRLAKEGVKLALCDMAGSPIQALKNRITDGGGEASAIPLASTSAGAVAETVAAVQSRFGRIDILVNHTPQPPRHALSELSAGGFDGTVDAILCLQARFLREVMPGMRRSGFGRVINIGSLAYLGTAKGIDVAAAQAGLFGLTRSAALEAARDNVTVNSVIAGEIANATMAEDETTALANGIPVKRLATLSDIAHAVGFFAAEKTKYVTGQTLFVCGGKSVYYSMSV